jgi:hypothetical protein
MTLQDFYYGIGAVAFVLAFIRIVYGWFRDFDNAQKFTADMARVHLPYIYNCMFRIANKLDLELDQAPTVNFANGRRQPQIDHNPRQT